jgi:hypothetical protein
MSTILLIILVMYMLSLINPINIFKSAIGGVFNLGESTVGGVTGLF